MPDWKARNTARARSLRRAATAAERALWTFLSRSQTGAKFSRQMTVGPYFADFLCRDLALVMAKQHGNIHRAAELRPATIVQILQSADAFRKPQRFARLLQA